MRRWITALMLRGSRAPATLVAGSSQCFRAFCGPEHTLGVVVRHRAYRTNTCSLARHPSVTEPPSRRRALHAAASRRTTPAPRAAAPAAHPRTASVTSFDVAIAFVTLDAVWLGDAPVETAQLAAHPHRRPAATRTPLRRGGAVAPRDGVCICHSAQQLAALGDVPVARSGTGATTRKSRPGGRLNQDKPAATYSPRPEGPSTIGAVGLNCSVRNGKRCFPHAIATGTLRDHPSADLENCTVATVLGTTDSQKRTVKPSDH